MARVPKVALAKTLAMRLTALLMPEAVPENSSITDFMTVVVSGATVKDIPSPKMRMPGKKVVQ